MKKLNLALILLVVFFQSCNSDDCGDCFTPPENFRFELVDKSSRENVFSNGTFNQNQIKITNMLNNSPAEFKFISENEINLIQINGIGFQTETIRLQIDLGNTPVFNFYVDAERKKEDCCSFTEFKDINITNSDFELDPQTGVYRILVE
ncbi:hypothetical protein ES711_02270 [Gelidibacter salicanalis]|uniref:Uncharacterized protein n=1 Tax=Gelidibacter salicanalis TaxID=291193 RepID=A0A5C7ARU9_9FLAO|nr:hypothetical protein [Gelidibacter salicanalis]TXE10754.1 hypothetical protein ES711_02270 [Gelidibacter salicanalis]